jgi:hypothetical protein
MYKCPHATHPVRVTISVALPHDTAQVEPLLLCMTCALNFPDKVAETLRRLDQPREIIPRGKSVTTKMLTEWQQLQIRRELAGAI